MTRSASPYSAPHAGFRLLPPHRLARLLLPPLVLLAGGCSLAPPYERPAMTLPAAFREASPGWGSAAPADDATKGAWWTLFDDPKLDRLVERAIVSNQNRAAAAAAYRQAYEAVRQSRAGLFPSIDLNGSGSRTEAFDGTSSGLTRSASSVKGTSFSGSLGASWQPDIWGRISNTTRQAQAEAQASAADLANATLAMQGELASDYFQLRGLDEQKILLDQASSAYEKTLAITRNRYREGVAAQSDVLQAETQWRNARAQAADLGRQRALYEHAIAVLIGSNPSTFALAPAPWRETVPSVPAILPGRLLERRPDIAAAERRVAAANAAIGIQKAAFFPTLSLSGSASTSGDAVSALFEAPTSLWSLGAGIALPLLDFGARSAKVKQARAAYDQAVASYRQTALSAFQQTEDGLVAARILADVARERTAAAEASAGAERIALQRYLAGQTDYTAVVTAQTAALSARQVRVQTVTNRQTTAIALIQAIGGAWDNGAP